MVELGLFTELGKLHVITKVRENCWKQDWVIDLDIKGFFDNIDHNKLMLAVEKNVPEKWVRLYIKRWLEAPVFTVSGKTIYKQGKGTPQGGVISPLLANLFLHYAFDKWIEKQGKVAFTRYADDVIVHCKSKVHAEWLLNAINQRMESVGLELHPQKTKIVYCRDHRRKGKHPIVKFKMYELTKVFRLLSRWLVWWARKRYKRYKTSIRKAYKWLANIRKQFPTLFYHWNFSQINIIA